MTDGWPIPLDDLVPDLESIRSVGISFGYPSCCVDGFVSDIAEGLFPAQLRGSVTGPAGEYVPCKACREEASCVSK